MAGSNENQGLQIALIIFVILTLVLSVSTFMFFRNYQEEKVKVTELTKQASDANLANQTTTKANNDLKRLMGFAENDSPDTVDKQYQQDMSTWAATVPEDSKSYRKALEFLFNTVNDRSTNLGGETDKNVALQATLAASEKKKTEQVAVHEASKKTDQDAYAKQAATFVEDKKRIEDQLAANQADMQQQRADITAKTADAAKEIQQLASTIQTLKARLENVLAERNSMQDPTFEVADGEIVWIDQNTGTVWINIGRDDSLKRRTTFSVYTTEANDLQDPQPKGKIEVTQILGQHLAEARILEDSLSDPLLIGDLIHTPIWTPGRAEHFALAGLLDLDGNGSSDRQAVRNLILQSGGVIDYEIGDDGKVTGEMTTGTRYLVLGAEQGNLDAISEANLKAKDLGLETLKLSEFLDHMGFKDPKRVLQFGVTPYEDFKPDRKDGEPRSAPGTNSSKRFEPRKPRDKRNTTYDAKPGAVPQ